MQTDQAHNVSPFLSGILGAAAFLIPILLGYAWKIYAQKQRTKQQSATLSTSVELERIKDGASQRVEKQTELEKAYILLREAWDDRDKTQKTVNEQVMEIAVLKARLEIAQDRLKICEEQLRDCVCEENKEKQ
jgi:septal ring factor EnvC (AmiA/AmiB activator)